MLPAIFSSNRMSFIGLTQYGLNPIANSPTYRLPSSVSKTSLSLSVAVLVASTILPSLNVSRMSLWVTPR